MEKKVACKDIDPKSSCNFEAKGNSAKQVADTMMAHVKSEHADSVQGMSDKEIHGMIESKVH